MSKSLREVISTSRNGLGDGDILSCFGFALPVGLPFAFLWKCDDELCEIDGFAPSAIRKLGVPDYEGLEAIVAISIAHISHLLSVIVLYHLTLTVFAGAVGTAFTAAVLHILSPAGLFLSAPYAESSCAFLTFAGCLLFAKSLGPSSATKDLQILASGLVLGLATTFRSNGLLNGILLLEEAFRTLHSLTQSFQPGALRRLFATGLGGLAVAVGFLFPQYIAYSEYCGQGMGRPWCERTFPSVYVFVQAHYW